ncbi:hypothetical protein JW868_03525 [Candidatus Woesearchaeota archaeon]|nr:hypothetical protein [Candidatus Woesearchaeota archaeon]
MARDQKVFNIDMDKYLSKRTSGGKSFSIRKKQPPVEDERVYYDSKKPGFFTKIFGRDVKEMEDEPVSDEVLKIEDEIEELDDESQVVEMMDEGIQEKKDGLMNKLFKSMRNDRKKKQEFDEDEIIHESIPELDEDIKEILKITFRWIEQLPKTKLKQFKESEDFEKYKLILMKYGLVKDK